MCRLRKDFVAVHVLMVCLSFPHVFGWFSGTAADPVEEWPHDRGRSHERKHHSSSEEKQRYYSCDRYGSREHCPSKSGIASCATSPSKAQEASLNKQVGWGCQDRTGTCVKTKGYVRG